MTNEPHAVGGRSETSGVIAWPWWAHQGSEYLVALLLISEAAHAEVDRAALGALGLLLAILTAVTEGPLGILEWFSVRLHRALDFLVVAILIAAPVLLNFHAIIGIITVESAGLALLWMTLHTQRRPYRGGEPQCLSVSRRQLLLTCHPPISLTAPDAQFVDPLLRGPATSDVLSVVTSPCIVQKAEVEPTA